MSVLDRATFDAIVNKNRKGMNYPKNQSELCARCDRIDAQLPESTSHLSYAEIAALPEFTHLANELRVLERAWMDDSLPLA